MGGRALPAASCTTSSINQCKGAAGVSLAGKGVINTAAAGSFVHQESYPFIYVRLVVVEYCLRGVRLDDCTWFAGAVFTDA